MKSFAAADQSADIAGSASLSSNPNLAGIASASVAIVLYLAAQWLAFLLTIKPDNISVYWPPAGVMFAALVVVRYVQWRLLLPGFLVATLIANWSAGRAMPLNVALSAADVIVGATGAYVYLRMSGRERPLESIAALSKFTACAILSAVLSSTLGVAILKFVSGYDFNELQVWAVWCGAMLTGMLLVAPLLMELVLGDRTHFSKWIRGEFGATIALSTMMLVIAYGGWSINDHIGLAAVLLLIPLMIWTAARCGLIQAALLLFAVSTVEIYCLTAGLGVGKLLPVPAANIEWVEAVVTLRSFTVLLIAAHSRQIWQLEAASRMQAETLSSVIDTATDGIISIDEMGVVRSFSTSAENHFGYSAEEVIGQNVKMLMPEYHRERHDGYLENYRRTGQRRIIGIGRMVSGQRKDGSIFPMELSVGEARIGNRRIFTGFVRDVSERQETEQRLHELQDELFHVSRLSAMGELASALAHELNQPLTAIKNYAQAGNLLIKKGGREKELPAILDKTIEQAGRAGEIIKRLRAYVTSKKIASEPENIHKIIEEACALALVGAKEDGIRATVVRSLDIPDLLVDRIQIQQVLINLIRNAIDAMRGTKRRDLIIEARRAGDFAQVRVADTGPGVEPAVLPNLFKPFITSKDSGMGVGLSISRTIAEAHGGTLHYEANPLGGAVFVLTLPVTNLADVDLEA
jgi:two-component system, LuxR family, sensor kinase FixL